MADIKHVVHIEVDPQTAMQKTVTVDGLKQWWTKTVRGEDAEGKQLEFRFSSGASCEFKVDRIDRDERIARWTCVNGADEWIGTQLSFRFKQVDEGTDLVFSHAGWREPTDFFGMCNFHWGQYLKSLKDYCEKGKGNPNEG